MRNIINICCCLIALVYILNVIGIFGAITNGSPHNKTIFCYYATYAAHRPGRGNFNLENFDPNLCTHLVYAFVLLNNVNTSLYLLAPLPDLKTNESNQENNISRLKSKYPHLKVTFSIGGWLDGSIKYSDMSASEVKRSLFVNSTLEFIKKYNFDGADIAWEFPAKRGGSKGDKQNFVHLIKELRQSFNKHNYILTAALDSSKDTIDYGYDVRQLSKYLHYMHIMTYDFNGLWSEDIGHNAPINSDDILLNINYTITYLLKLGADRRKLLLGVPFYGRTFIMENPADLINKLPKIEGNYKNYSFGGPFTQEDGFLGYNEICSELIKNSSQWKVYWDDFGKVPFAINGDKFITYDNIKSVKEKVQFAINYKLGGIAVWSVDTDDFRGDCHEMVDGNDTYPLLRTINIEIDKYLANNQFNSTETDTTTDNIRATELLENSARIFSINFLLIIFSSYFVICND